MSKKLAKYKKEYPLLMYRFFRSFSDSGAPSFQKFAASIGVLYEDLESFRRYLAFPWVLSPPIGVEHVSKRG